MTKFSKICEDILLTEDIGMSIKEKVNELINSEEFIKSFSLDFKIDKTKIDSYLKIRQTELYILYGKYIKRMELYIASEKRLRNDYDIAKSILKFKEEVEVNFLDSIKTLNYPDIFLKDKYTGESAKIYKNLKPVISGFKFKPVNDILAKSLEYVFLQGVISQVLEDSLKLKGNASLSFAYSN